MKSNDMAILAQIQASNPYDLLGFLLTQALAKHVF